MFYRVWVASQRFHGNKALTYAADEPLTIGQIVSVPLQRRGVLGVVERQDSKPHFATRKILAAWPVSVPPKAIQLLEWLRKYYPAPSGTITELFTPPNLPKKLTFLEQKITAIKPLSLPALTTEQISVINTIARAGGSPVLLHGETGTGKTRVYLELARQNLAAGKSIIMLTPEIGLTQPLVQAFADQFGDRVFVTHSQLTPAERRGVWLACSEAKKPLVIIGPRSALFVPLQQIGLIVMDEAHDSAYKQEQAPYYQTSRVAAQLAKLHGGQLVMGTATPLVSDYFTFERKQLPIVRMTELPIKTTHHTTVKVLDHRERHLFTRSAWLANPLVRAIELALEQGEQSLLFLNRRGSARLILCQQCGWQAVCPHCDVPLTYHQDQHMIRCHSCDFRGSVPTACPECGAPDLVFRSVGTKALETEIQRLFPKARVKRFDRDSNPSERLTSQYQALYSGNVDIVIGTQAIAKGFDLPKLSVVGIVQADSGLQFPDYSASERAYQLISQVSGRIGRGHRAGQLFVQTFDPKSYLISLALQKDYQAFYQQELQERQLYSFPPFVFLLKLTCIRASSKSSFEACQKVANMIRALEFPIVIEGPSPRFVHKQGGRYAWHLIIKSKDRKYLTKIVSTLPSNALYDLDPTDLL